MPDVPDGGSSVPRIPVLMLNFYYPPHGGPAPQRPGKLVKHLPDFGIEPHVVYVTHEVSHMRDYSLLDDIHPAVRSYCVSAPTLSKAERILYYALYLSGLEAAIPRRRAPWYLRFLELGTRLIRKHGIRAIFTASSPYTNHLTGKKLQARTGVRRIMDYGDSWSRNPILVSDYQRRFGPLAGLRTMLDVIFEQNYLRGTGRAAVCSPTHRDELVDDFNLASDKIIYLPMGYDQEDFAALPNRDVPEGRPMELLFVGTFYKGFEGTLKKVIDASESSPIDHRLRFVGDCSRQLADLGLADRPRVETHPYVPHHEVLQMMRNADGLFLMTFYDSHVPGKFYEYMNAGPPVVAATPRNSDLARLMTMIGAGWVVPTTPEFDVSAWHEALKAIEQGIVPESGGLSRENWEWRNLAKRLATHFHALHNGQH